ncbi:MAG: NAD(P)-dependent oxidoreductase [Pseudomonadota bacterium]|jgi:nucleoside-diphosphate-sugar epimerase
MTVLVIGSGGYMGRHLMAGLSRSGVGARGMSSADGSGIDPESGLLPAAFAIPSGTTTVVYMAQSPRYREVPEQAAHVLAVNTLSAVRAATLARAAGVRRFVYVSTGTVYAPSFTPIAEDAPVRRDSWYVLSKLHGEEALSLFRQDMEVIIVRPFGIYGPAQKGRLVPNIIESVMAGKPIGLQPRPDDPDDGEGLRISLCYIDDATDVLLRLVRNGGPAYLNLAGSEALSIRSIANRIGTLTSRQPVFQQSSTPRDTDLVADIHLLQDAVHPLFTRFEDGLARTWAAMKESSC